MKHAHSHTYRGLCTTAAWPRPALKLRDKRGQGSAGHRLQGLPGARKHVTLYGILAAPAFYVDRIRFLPGMKVCPIAPDTVRTVCVMSGTFYFAVGEQWDESKLVAYPAGPCIPEPPRTRTMHGPRTER